MTTTQNHTKYKLLDKNNKVIELEFNDGIIGYKFSNKGYSYMTLKYLDHDISDEKNDDYLAKGYYLPTVYKK